MFKLALAGVLVLAIFLYVSFRMLMPDNGRVPDQKQSEQAVQQHEQTSAIERLARMFRMSTDQATTEVRQLYQSLHADESFDRELPSEFVEELLLADFAMAAGKYRGEVQQLLKSTGSSKAAFVRAKLQTADASLRCLAVSARNCSDCNFEFLKCLEFARSASELNFLPADEPIAPSLPFFTEGDVLRLETTTAWLNSAPAARYWESIGLTAPTTSGGLIDFVRQLKDYQGQIQNAVRAQAKGATATHRDREAQINELVIDFEDALGALLQVAP